MCTVLLLSTCACIVVMSICSTIGCDVCVHSKQLIFVWFSVNIFKTRNLQYLNFLILFLNWLILCTILNIYWTYILRINIPYYLFKMKYILWKHLNKLALCQFIWKSNRIDYTQEVEFWINMSGRKVTPWSTKSIGWMMDGWIDQLIDWLIDLNWNSASCLEFKIGPEIKVI